MCSARLVARAGLALALGGSLPGCTAPAPARDAAATRRSAAACPWPDSLDAVRAAPRNHRVVLENDTVRVLDVTVAPGERERLHAHCLPSVMYLQYEGRYRDYDAAGNVTSEVRTAAPDSVFPMTLWLPPQAPHAVENLDTRPVRLLRVEFKR
jgi:quercetin dioxygenase-like cupin family protein